MANQIANTILSQLGGNQLRAMTGARNFVSGGGTGGSNPYVQFRIPNRSGPNMVRVELDRGRDTYNTQYSRVRGNRSRVLRSTNDVYADQLRGDFERSTGLRTSLTRTYARRASAVGGTAGGTAGGVGGGG